MVIYATMMGYMPRFKDVVVDDMETTLFGTARRLQASESSAGFPGKDEAAQLFKIAKKVALNGYTPKSIRGFKTEEDANEFIEDVSSSTYQGNDYTVSVYSGQGNYNYYQNGEYSGQYDGGNDYYGGQYGDNGYNGQYGGNYGANNNNGYNRQYGGNYGNNNGQ
jgi:hypothetical protein